MNWKLLIKKVMVFGFFVFLSQTVYAEPVAPSNPISNTDQMDTSLSKSLEKAQKLFSANEELAKKYEEFSTQVDEIRIQLRRRHRKPHP